MTTLTNKETMLIKEEKANEELCIAKYEKSIKEAQDPELKQLFSSILSHEKQHLTSLNRILNGDVPNIQQEAQSQQSSNQQSSSQNSPQSNTGNFNQGNSQFSNSGFNNSQLNIFQNEMNSKFSMETASEISPNNKFHGDYTLCQDALSTEKYISSSYNTAIFDCLDTQIRKVLNHIQKEEQEHGEQISNYMISHGYAQVK
ncbi:spore coat protein [Clostridium perfringens]|nr:spore coat protein [Clostridium perfringens]